MDSALCLANGRQYTGPEFAALDGVSRDQYRRQLVCVKCRTAAYFRKESRSGQGPCFGARPHTNCVLASPESARGVGYGTEEDILHNPGTSIVIDVAQGAYDRVNVDVTGGRAGSARGASHTREGGRRDTKSHRRLRPLLRNLIHLEAFRSSTQTIELPEYGAWAVRDLFVRFEDVDDIQRQGIHGFWGVIYSTGRTADGALWLNSGWNGVSVVIRKDQIEPFLQRHRIDIDELDGSHVLVFGTLKRSGRGKAFIRLESVELSALNDD